MWRKGAVGVRACQRAWRHGHGWSWCCRVMLQGRCATADARLPCLAQPPPLPQQLRVHHRLSLPLPRCLSPWTPLSAPPPSVPAASPRPVPPASGAAARGAPGGQHMTRQHVSRRHQPPCIITLCMHNTSQAQLAKQDRHRCSQATTASRAPDGCAAAAAALKQRTLAGCPSRTTRSPLPASPSTRLSTAALVSAHASSGPMAAARLGCSSDVRTSTSTSASSVRVLPVPGGPCHSVRLRTTACAIALRWQRRR